MVLTFGITTIKEDARTNSESTCQLGPRVSTLAVSTNCERDLHLQRHIVNSSYVSIN